MLGRLVRPAAVFGIVYLALMYVLNPPHFGHTGESHFLYVDRNVVEILMLVCVMAWRKYVPTTGGTQFIASGRDESRPSREDKEVTQ